jgi:hypothetical protein
MVDELREYNPTIQAAVIRAMTKIDFSPGDIKIPIPAKNLEAAVTRGPLIISTTYRSNRIGHSPDVSGSNFPISTGTLLAKYLENWAR